MNWWSSGLVALLVVAAHSIAVASALECYICNTDRDGACKTPKEDDVPTCSNGDLCYKTINDKRSRPILYCATIHSSLAQPRAMADNGYHPTKPLGFFHTGCGGLRCSAVA